MKSVALRFTDNFAPEEGTIIEHEKMINKYGFVYYGKLGNPLSQLKITDILKEKVPKVLLVKNSGKACYWAYISEITRQVPELEYIPSYYRDNYLKFKTWIKIDRIESVDSKILSQCLVGIDRKPLSTTLKKSMNSFFYFEIV